jgi:hypothetical protein
VLTHPSTGRPTVLRAGNGATGSAWRPVEAPGSDSPRTPAPGIVRRAAGRAWVPLHLIDPEYLSSTLRCLPPDEKPCGQHPGLRTVFQACDTAEWKPCGSQIGLGATLNDDEVTYNQQHRRNERAAGWHSKGRINSSSGLIWRCISSYLIPLFALRPGAARPAALPCPLLPAEL